MKANFERLTCAYWWCTIHNVLSVPMSQESMRFLGHSNIIVLEENTKIGYFQSGNGRYIEGDCHRVTLSAYLQRPDSLEQRRMQRLRNVCFLPIHQSPKSIITMYTIQCIQYNVYKVRILVQTILLVEFRQLRQLLVLSSFTWQHWICRIEDIFLITESLGDEIRGCG